MKYFQLFFFTFISLLALISCGGSDDDPSSRVELSTEHNAYRKWEASDGSKYECFYDSTSESSNKRYFHLVRIINDSEVASLKFSTPYNVTQDLGYGEIGKQYYNLNSADFTEFGNYMIFAMDTEAENVPGVMCVIKKDLSSYETRDILGGKRFWPSGGKLYIQDYGSTKYELYDNVMGKILSGSVNNTRFDSFIANSNIAFGEYNGQYYVLTELRFKHSSGSRYSRIVILNTGEDISLKIGEINDIAGYFPDEENKPKVNSTKFTFNTDHFEIVMDITYYSGEEGTVIRQIGLDGNEIGHVIS